MSKPNDINLNTYEKMASIKNSFGNSIIEILKPNIKSHQNESVFKMLEIAKDKPESYIELLSVAIFHKNFEIIKYMVEKCKITEGDSPFMNALSFQNSILPENLKLNEPKENYNLIQCPFSIMCAIGGDVEIFKYLSKKNLISNKNEIGIIGLSKKLKNAFYSNMVGAACYYGRTEFLEYILKNYKIDINIQTTEKKSKSGLKVGFSKEYHGLYPPMLGVVSDISDETTVKILKILNNYNCKLKNCDNNKDNIIHLATKNKKILTVKYLIDELNLTSLLNDNNKDGYTPLSLAQHLNNEIFINYFSDKEKINEKEIEENLKELIEESNQIKNKNEKKKKKKNKNNDEPALLNSTEYEETLKEEKPNKNKKKKKKYNYSNNYNTKETNEEEEYIPYEENNENDNNKEDNNNKYYSSQNKEKLRALLENNPKPKKKKKKDNDIKSNINIEKKEDTIKDIKIEEIKEIPKEKEIKENNSTKQEQYSQENDDEFIIGLGSKNKKNKKFKKNYKEEKEKEKEEKIKLQLEQEEKKKKEEEERIKKEQEIEEQRLREEEEQKRLEEEEQKRLEEEERLRKIQEEELIRRQKLEEERLRKIQEQEELLKKQRQQEEEAKQRKLQELKELQEKQALEKEKEKEKEKNESNEEKEESEEDEDYSSEKNFLSEHEESKEKDESQKYVSKEDYNNLSKKYLELERRISVLEKEKEEMSSLLRTLFLQSKKNKQIPLTENKEENINDLMKLANEELEKKNNIINNLQGKVDKLNLDNINEFSEDKLKEYKDFYNKKLKTINDALKKY